MDQRELIRFAVSEEDLRIQKEKIIPYWEKRSIRHKILSSMSEEWKAAYECGIFTEFMEQRGPGHTVGSVSYTHLVPAESRGKAVRRSRGGGRFPLRLRRDNEEAGSCRNPR